jgi:hypothetical protein
MTLTYYKTGWRQDLAHENSFRSNERYWTRSRMEADFSPLCVFETVRGNHQRNLNMQIDTVQQRPGNLLSIIFNLPRGGTGASRRHSNRTGWIPI